MAELLTTRMAEMQETVLRQMDAVIDNAGYAAADVHHLPPAEILIPNRRSPSSSGRPGAAVTSTRLAFAARRRGWGVRPPPTPSTPLCRVVT